MNQEHRPPGSRSAAGTGGPGLLRSLPTADRCGSARLASHIRRQRAGCRPRPADRSRRTSRQERSAPPRVRRPSASPAPRPRRSPKARSGQSAKTRRSARASNATDPSFRSNSPRRRDVGTAHASKPPGRYIISQDGTQTQNRGPRSNRPKISRKKLPEKNAGPHGEQAGIERLRYLILQGGSLPPQPPPPGWAPLA